MPSVSWMQFAQRVRQHQCGHCVVCLLGRRALAPCPNGDSPSLYAYQNFIYFFYSVIILLHSLGKCATNAWRLLTDAGGGRKEGRNGGRTDEEEVREVKRGCIHSESQAL